MYSRFALTPQRSMPRDLQDLSIERKNKTYKSIKLCVDICICSL